MGRPLDRLRPPRFIPSFAILAVATGSYLGAFALTAGRRRRATRAASVPATP